jgi:hypothetical protein
MQKGRAGTWHTKKEIFVLKIEEKAGQTITDETLLPHYFLLLYG